MNKADLIEKVAEKSSQTSLKTGEVINLVFQEIIDALAKGETVKFVGFGVFDVKYRKPRKRNNPKTGEILDVEGSTAVVFRAGKNLKTAIEKVKSE